MLASLKAPFRPPLTSSCRGNPHFHEDEYTVRKRLLPPNWLEAG